MFSFSFFIHAGSIDVNREKRRSNIRVLMIIFVDKNRGVCNVLFNILLFKSVFFILILITILTTFLK